MSRSDMSNSKNITGDNKVRDKNERLKEILGTSLYYLFVILFSVFLVKFIGQRTEVIGSSMLPTLVDGDSVLLDKVSYRFRDPKRFEIVVFPFRNDSGDNYIKRIIGLPGETVRIDYEGNIYINEVLLEEHYGRATIKFPGNAAEGFKLGPDEYYVMGDNRNESEDSRTQKVGAVKKDEIVGRAIYIIWPFSRFGRISK